MRTRAEIVERAATHLGHREASENDSVLIRAWLRRCGVATPAPWCAAFASWCLEDRAMAGALALGRSFPATDDPRPGDLCYFATNAKGNGHVGVVVAGNADEVLVVEGNSGNQVRAVRRRRSEVKFARTRDDVATPLPELPTGPVFARLAPLVPVSFEGTR